MTMETNSPEHPSGVLYVAGPARVKRCAWALQEALAAVGEDVSYSRCLELAARLYGYQNYRMLHLTQGLAPPSPADEDIDPALVEARYQLQERAMEAAGFGAFAGIVLDRVNPTGRVIAKKSRLRKEAQEQAEAVAQNRDK